MLERIFALIALITAAIFTVRAENKVEGMENGKRGREEEERVEEEEGLDLMDPRLRNHRRAECRHVSPCCFGESRSFQDWLAPYSLIFISKKRKQRSRQDKIAVIIIVIIKKSQMTIIHK